MCVHNGEKEHIGGSWHNSTKIFSEAEFTGGYILGPPLDKMGIHVDSHAGICSVSIPAPGWLKMWGQYINTSVIPAAELHNIQF